MPYFFFLSYARGSLDNDVERFFKDLSDEVRDLAGLSRTEEVGFLDRHSLELGAAWPRQLVRALSECSTFLALCTPRYFLSEPCGKEWWIFEDRLNRYERANHCLAPMLIPLLWLPTRRMPQRAQERQYTHERLAPAYAEDGLRQLIRLSSHHDAYVTAVNLLARHIVEQAEAHHIPARNGALDFHRIPNAFADQRASDPDPGAPPPTSRYIHFVVAAPSRQEVTAARLRRDLTFYGDTRHEWAPYRPPWAIAETAKIIAAEHNFDSGVTSIEGLEHRLDQARANNQMTVFLVDAWATKLDEHRRALVACDTWGEEADESPPSAIMVPMSHSDEETQANSHALSNQLRVVFANRFARSDGRMFRPSVLSPEAFDADLRVALSVAQNRMHVHGTPRREMPDDDGPPGLPTLGLPELR